jgi:uncharacterized protein YaiL (DUF2058 family)
MPDAIHTVPAKSGWVNRKEGSNRSLSTHRTKAEATRAGRERAKRDKAEHIIHNKDGSISARNSYGHDPRHREG